MEKLATKLFFVLSVFVAVLSVFDAVLGASQNHWSVVGVWSVIALCMAVFAFFYHKELKRLKIIAIE